jgi:hypothetical protein
MFFPFDYYASFLIKFFYILSLIVVTVLIYISACYFFKISEIKFFLKKIKGNQWTEIRF